MNKETLGTLFAVIAAIISGISIPANKVFVVNLDPAVFTAVRAIVIGIAFLLVARWQFAKSNKIKKVKQKKFVASWKYLIVIGIVGGSFAFLLFFSGLKLTTTGHAAFLQKTLPLYVTVLAFLFLHEKITRKYLGAMILMFLGAVAIYFTQINPADLWANPQLGDILVISATILWAIENIIAKKAMKNGSNNFVVSFGRMFFGGLILFGVVILTGKIDALLSLDSQQMLNIGISTVLLFAYVLFYYWSLQHINVSKATVMLLLAPIVSLVIGITVLGEPAPVIQLVGCFVILAGVYLISGIKSEQRGV